MSPAREAATMHLGCHHGYADRGGETVFDVEAPRVKYGRGALREVGPEARALDLRRVAVVTDPTVAKLPFFASVLASLEDAGVEAVVFDASSVEPTDASFLAAAEFARDAQVDGFVSVGGGSAIDTAKAANLYSTYPAPFAAYVNAPLGEARPVPGPVRAHIACPTTCGTGSECTGMAIFDFLAHGVKTGIASKRLRPSLGIIDPDVLPSLPGTVVACSGFDVLSHALESFTAKPFTARHVPSPGARPMSQGANPFSDLACIEALRITGAALVPAVTDPDNHGAREQMLFAAMLAGIGFGNAGVHAPHGMAYAVAGGVRTYHAPDYPGDEPIVPHGMSVIVNAPAVARFTAPADPERHLIAARLLGGGDDATASEAGEALAERLVALMRATAMPDGLAALGYVAADIATLARGAYAQQRLLANAPRPIDEDVLATLFTDAMQY